MKFQAALAPRLSTVVARGIPLVARESFQSQSYNKDKFWNHTCMDAITGPKLLICRIGLYAGDKALQ